jgi:leucyl aminopeptidase (aminopeptidase T)
MDTDRETLSKHVLDVCLSAKPGQRVWINSWDHTLDLASDLAWECRRRGCQVLLTVQPESLWLRSMIEAPIELIDNLPAHFAAALEETDIYIYTLGPRKPIPWDNIPRERRKSISVWLDTRYDKSKFAEQWAQISKTRKVRMLGIEATLATPERAEAMGLDFEEWQRVMSEGCAADPIEIASRGRALEPLMRGEGQVHVTTTYGTDLAFSLGKRPVDYSYGLATEEKAERGEVVFLPTGGIEASAAEDTAEGRVVYDTTIRSGTGQIERLTLQVEHGRVKQFSARSGKEIFESYFRQGRGDEDRFTYFGFGLNPKLRLGFGQDDKVLGSTVLGLGNGQWWAAVAKATVTINGQKIMEDGKLLV